jgi:S-adenosylmethionine hydrolase
MPPVLTFLSDYGLDDEFVGVCHGVIARVAPRTASPATTCAQAR